MNEHPGDYNIYDLEKALDRKLTDLEIRIFRVGWALSFQSGVNK